MEREYITGVVYTELNDALGPNPIYWVPLNMSEEIRTSVSIKTITLLTAEQGMIPKSLIFLPFPSLNLKALIKYIQWKDESVRGGFANSAITILFREVDDIVFYKYFQELQVDFNHYSKKFQEIESKERNLMEIEGEILKLRNSINTILEEHREKELSTKRKKEFPTGYEDSDRVADYQFKIIICGDPTVGKTSMVLRFTDDAFRRFYLPTLGIHVSKKKIKVDGALIELVLWDVAGQQKFSTMRTQFYHGSRGVLLVFDLTNPESYDSIEKWYKDIKENRRRDDKIIGYVIGNKIDLKEERRISKNLVSNLAYELDLDFFETSALTGENINDAFYSIAKNLYLESIKDE